MGLVFDRIDRQLDNELLWILTETTAAVFRDARESGKDLKRGKFCKEIGRSIGAALIEREGDAVHDIALSEFEEIAWKAAGSGKKLLGEDSDDAAMSIAELCVAYMEMRKLGIDAPYPAPRPGSRWDNFDPFANEGGFCNPIKLKMLDD
jgi:hypothetical protein